jgi:hypothetical protein
VIGPRPVWSCNLFTIAGEGDASESIPQDAADRPGSPPNLPFASTERRPHLGSQLIKILCPE